MPPVHADDDAFILEDTASCSSHDLDFERLGIGGAAVASVPSTPAAATRGRREQRTVESLNQARALTRQALKVVEDDRAAQAQERQLQVNHQMVSLTLKKKMGLTEDLIRALDERIESLEDTMRKVGECLFSLQRAFRAKWAPLNVCERRLQLREARPKEELIRDSCQDALENERQILAKSRQELLARIDGLKEAMLGLEALKGELLEDMQHKRHALRIDRSCLDPKKKQQERLVLPALPEVVHYGTAPAPKDAEAGTGKQHEEQRQVSTRELIGKAAASEEDAMRLGSECDAVIAQMKPECSRAGSQVQAALSKRLEETQRLRKELELQLRETDEAISRMEMSLAVTRRRFASHEHPVSVLDVQLATRTGRTEREEIRDQVHEEFDGHLEIMKRNLKNLGDKRAQTEDLLEQLKMTKQLLQEDYRRKSAAAKIDDACLRVTPKKSMELDRLDARGGRCKEPYSARRKHFHPASLEAS